MSEKNNLSDEGLARLYHEATGQTLRERDKALAFAFARAVERAAAPSASAQPAEQVDLDGCTEENCRRCRTQKALRTPDMFHAGISSAADDAAFIEQGESVASTVNGQDWRRSVYRISEEIRILATNLPDEWLREEFQGFAGQLVNIVQMPAAPSASAQPVAQDECAQDVYECGQSIGLFDIPKEAANAICAGIAAITGARVDWHYVGGRVHMKALAAPAPKRKPLEAFATVAEWAQQDAGPNAPKVNVHSPLGHWTSGRYWKPEELVKTYECPLPEWRIQVAGPAGYVRFETFTVATLADALEEVRKQGLAWVADEDGDPIVDGVDLKSYCHECWNPMDNCICAASPAALTGEVRELVDTAFQAIFDAYNQPGDRFENDYAWCLNVRKKVGDAYTPLQQARALLSATPLAADKERA